MSPQLWFVHADHLDRPIKMTNGAQSIVWDAVYRPFGEPVSITGVASNNLRFPGQYFLIESGLHYNWHRQYDPTTGRYLQPDPLQFIDGPSLYSYAKSTPTMLTDPSGRFGWRGAVGSALGNAALQFTFNYIQTTDVRTSYYCISLKDVALSSVAGYFGPTLWNVITKTAQFSEYLGFSSAKAYVSASGPEITIADVFPPASPLVPFPANPYRKWLTRFFY